MTGPMSALGARWFSARALLIVTALSIAATAACGGGVATGPPDINYGRDVCDQCHMIISEARYAAAYRDAKGEAFIFDDIGDMLQHVEAAGIMEEITAWVHDYESEEWVEVTDAWFVKSVDIETPMGGGIIAFERQQDAERFDPGDTTRIYRWAELASAPETVPNGGDGHG